MRQANKGDGLKTLNEINAETEEELENEKTNADKITACIDTHLEKLDSDINTFNANEEEWREHEKTKKVISNAKDAMLLKFTIPKDKLNKEQVQQIKGAEAEYSELVRKKITGNPDLHVDLCRDIEDIGMMSKMQGESMGGVKGSTRHGFGVIGVQAKTVKQRKQSEFGKGFVAKLLSRVSAPFRKGCDEENIGELFAGIQARAANGGKPPKITLRNHEGTLITSSQYVVSDKITEDSLAWDRENSKGVRTIDGFVDDILSHMISDDPTLPVVTAEEAKEILKKNKKSDKSHIKIVEAKVDESPEQKRARWEKREITVDEMKHELGEQQYEYFADSFADALKSSMDANDQDLNAGNFVVVTNDQGNYETIRIDWGHALGNKQQGQIVKSGFVLGNVADLAGIGFLAGDNTDPETFLTKLGNMESSKFKRDYPGLQGDMANRLNEKISEKSSNLEANLPDKVKDLEEEMRDLLEGGNLTDTQMREVLDVSSSISSRSKKNNAARNRPILNLVGVLPLVAINLAVRAISFISSFVTRGKIKPTGLTSLTLTSLAIDFSSKASNVGLERGEMIDKIINQQTDQFIDRQIDLAPVKQTSSMKKRIKQEVIIRQADIIKTQSVNLDALNLDAPPPALKQGTEIKRLTNREPNALSSNANAIDSSAEMLQGRQSRQSEVAKKLTDPGDIPVKTPVLTGRKKSGG